MSGKPNPRFIIMERRERILVLLAQGLNESEIAAQLKVGQSTICRDFKALNRESYVRIKTLETEHYPLQFQNIMNSIREVLKKSWEIIEDTSGIWTNKDKINAMKLIIDASRTNFEILQNGPLNLRIDDLRKKVEKLQDTEETTKSYFTLPALETTNQSTPI